MSWEIVAEAVKDQLEALPELKGHVSIEDMKVLGAGTQLAAVIDYGGFDQARDAFGGSHMFTWRAMVRIYARWQDDLTIRERLRILRGSVLGRLNAHSELGDVAGVVDAFVSSGEPLPEAVEVGSVKFFGETLRLDVQDFESVDYED